MKYLLLTILVLTSILNAEYYRIYLNNKGLETLEKESKEYKNVLASLSEKSIERRKEHLGDDIISMRDLPIFIDYKNEIQKFGEVRLEVKWFNYIVANIDTEYLQYITDFSFVNRVEVVSDKTITLELATATETNHLNQIMNGIYEYGKATNQVEMLNIPSLHKMGFNGENTRLGFLDAGFDPLLALARFPENNIENYDFVSDDDSVQYQLDDPTFAFHHGTNVMSTVLGYFQDSLVGVSTASEYLLARTEDVSQEVQLETDFFVAGIEWLEARGCDVVNSSLGYRYFQDGEESFDFSDLDGHSTLLAQSINISTKLGVVHATSAGNYGSDGDSTLISPADADSVLSVSGVNREGEAWNLSSQGPRAGGGIFPNIAAQGAGVAISITSDPEEPKFEFAGGTSFASPLIAGCASLLKSAFPELKSYEVRELLFRASSDYEEPNLKVGYGFPDMVKAFELAGVAISNPSQYKIESKERIASYIFSKDGIDEALIYLENPSTKDYDAFKLRSKDGLIYYFDIVDTYFKNDTAKYYIEINKSGNLKRLPFSSEEYLKAVKDNEQITCGVDALELPTHIDTVNTSLELELANQIVYQNGVLEIGNIGSNIRNIDLEVIDLQGNIIFRENLNLNFKNQIRLTEKLSNGVFIVRINSNSINISKKIIEF